MPTYQKEYEEPRDKKLEMELLKYDDVNGYTDAIWKKYIKTEEDEDDDEKNDKMEREWRKVDTALENIFIAVYNSADTVIPADEIHSLISEFNVWGDEHDNSLEDQLLKFLRALKEWSNNPPKKDRYGRLVPGELHEELVDILYKEYGDY